MIVIRITLSYGTFRATSGVVVDSENASHHCTSGYQAREIATAYCAENYGSPWEVVGFGNLPNADDEWVAVIASDPYIPLP